MTDWYPGLAGIIDKGFGGSRGSDTINGVVEHHTANGGGTSALSYVANANSRNSHPNYLIQNSGASFGIVHPNRRPFSTAGRPDTEAIAFEIDNESGAPNWNISNAAAEALAQIIAFHYKQSPRFGNGIARNIPGVLQKEFFVAWHSQYVATACPGPNIRDQRQDAIIARAMQIAHPVTPPPAGTQVKEGALVGVKAAFGVYGSSLAATQGGAPKTTYPAGNYTVYKVAGAAVNLTKTAGKPGGWVLIKNVGLTPPAPVIFKVVFDDSPNDDTSNYLVVEVEEGKTVAKPADPVLAGNTFDGWHRKLPDVVENKGIEEAVYDFSKPVTAMLTLVAQFTPIPVEPSDPDLDPEVKTFLEGLGKSISDFVAAH